MRTRSLSIALALSGIAGCSVLVACSSGQPAPSPGPLPARTEKIAEARGETALFGSSLASAKREYVPASIVATPGAHCQLHPEGSTDTAESIPVVVNEDGVARFHAVRAATADALGRLALDCTSGAGETTTYPVDLRSETTFAPRPLDLRSEPGADRPALAGDPLSYSRSELARKGYGLRPDPATRPQSYARWLAAATRPGRLLGGDPSLTLVSPQPVEHKALTPQGTVTKGGGAWTGAVLNGEPTYSEVNAQFIVPKPIPGGFGTTNTQAAIWAGLGGYGTAGGLIQGGIWMSTTSSALSLYSFTEYCCGDSPSGEKSAKFNANPGDEIYIQEWYCDAFGNENTNVNAGGGYGCSYVSDETSGALVSCASANDPTCTSIPPLYQSNWVIGNSADFVMELTPYPQWPDFGGTVTMSGAAYGANGETVINGDTSTIMLEDSTATTNQDHVSVSIPGPGSVSWTATPGGPDLAWYDATSGEISVWEISNGTVTGTQDLGTTCSIASGCGNAWTPIDGQANSLLWDDPTSGELSTWSFDASGTVSVSPNLSWTCTTASGCATAWRAIGRTTEGGQAGLLWHDAASGALSIWNVSGSTVTGSTAVSLTCGGSCSAAWRAMLTADMNNDGNTDIVWYDASSGVVSVWLLSGGTVLRTENLTWTCSQASGCGTAWSIVGAADVNGDGHTDLSWYDSSNGQISTWLLNGAGTVTGSQVLSLTCSTASGCAKAWRPIGYVEFP